MKNKNNIGIGSLVYQVYRGGLRNNQASKRQMGLVVGHYDEAVPGSIATQFRVQWLDSGRELWYYDSDLIAAEDVGE